jgi:hypothetical protein
MEATGYRLQATGLRLQASGCKLQDTGYRLQASKLCPVSCNLWPELTILFNSLNKSEQLSTQEFHIHVQPFIAFFIFK